MDDMRQRKDGERIIFDGRPATVQLRPASGSGMQMIFFDDIHHWLGKVLWVHWKKLAEAQDAPCPDGQ